MIQIHQIHQNTLFNLFFTVQKCCARWIVFAFCMLIISTSFGQNGIVFTKLKMEGKFNISEPAGNSNNPFGGDTTYKNDPSEENYDEILVTLNVQGIGSFEMPAIIWGEVAYLPVKELFDVLKIKNKQSHHADSIEGFFINPNATFLIDKISNQIFYQGKIVTLKSADLIRTDGGLFLRSDVFGSVFGLDCNFTFRSLSIALNSKTELPAIRDMKLEALHKNINKLKGSRKADTLIDVEFSPFRLGMADWSVISTQTINENTNTRINLGIGAIFAGGETNIFLAYSNREKFRLSKQNYYWRFVNNDHTALRQIIAGKIAPQAVSTIYNSVTGIQLTNAPTTFRRSFGTYTLSDKTEPGWMVELYVNNILVNYATADASGFFTFQVPMVYGYSAVKLRFYGPWGEERIKEQNIAIPFSFLPQNEFEYNFSAGVVDDVTKSFFSRATANYGLSKQVTVGGGMEYLSSVTSGKAMPFLNTSVRLGALFVSGEHVYGVRSKALFTYRLPSNLAVDLSYINYNKTQTAINVNYTDEKKAVLSMPFRSKKFAAYSRLTVNQFTLAQKSFKSKYTTAELLFSGVFAGISSNVTTQAMLPADGKPIVYSNFSMTFRLPAKINITPQARYEYGQNKLSSLKLEVEKSMFRKGYLNASYEKNSLVKGAAFGLGFRYNFSFAQVSFSARQSKQLSTTTQTARGSLMYDGYSNYLGATEQNNVGRGGVIIAPYLDLNCNGYREANEPAAAGLKVRINGGRIERNNKDTTIRIVGLEAYANYFLELDKNSFDNIAWQIRNETIRMIIEPNNFKLLEVPVAVVGEVSGSVLLSNDKGLNGLGRMKINIYNNQSEIVAKTLTEEDGYFSYVGLAPGNYTALIDAAQLSKLNMKSSPLSITFTVKANRDGDVVDGLQFTVQNKK